MNYIAYLSKLLKMNPLSLRVLNIILKVDQSSKYRLYYGRRSGTLKCFNPPTQRLFKRNHNFYLKWNHYQKCELKWRRTKRNHEGGKRSYIQAAPFYRLNLHTLFPHHHLRFQHIPSPPHSHGPPPFLHYLLLLLRSFLL